MKSFRDMSKLARKSPSPSSSSSSMQSPFEQKVDSNLFSAQSPRGNHSSSPNSTVSGNSIRRATPKPAAPVVRRQSSSTVETKKSSAPAASVKSSVSRQTSTNSSLGSATNANVKPPITRLGSSSSQGSTPHTPATQGSSTKKASFTRLASVGYDDVIRLWDIHSSFVQPLVHSTITSDVEVIDFEITDSGASLIVLHTPKGTFLRDDLVIDSLTTVHT